MQNAQHLHGCAECRIEQERVLKASDRYDAHALEIVALNRYARTAHRPVIVLADLKRRA